MQAIAIALALLDFAPVFFLTLGLFFLAQLVDRLDRRCRRMSLAALALVALGGIGRALSNLALAITGEEIQLLATTLYVFAAPGFTLMASALVRARATASGRGVSRDPWIAPSVISWSFLGLAFYLSSTPDGAREWSRLLLFLGLMSMAVTSLTAAALGWARRLHMAAGLFGLSTAGTALFVLLRFLAPQSLLIQLLGELTSLAAQMAFAFASWRVAAEYEARVGPIATK